VRGGGRGRAAEGGDRERAAEGGDRERAADCDGPRAAVRIEA
jgi:hypothetical protein